MSEQAQSATAQLLKKTKKMKVMPKESAKLDESDLLVVTAHEIENLSMEQALSEADVLVNNAGLNDFKLGGLLSVIQSNKWFEGFDSFRAMVEQKYGLHYRKAMYLISIYTDLVDAQIPWQKVKDLGWSKLKEIAHILSQENVDEWVEKAKILTVLQLQEAVKAFLNKGKLGEDAADGDTVTSTVTTMTFKVHPDQKVTIRQALDRAKEDAGTEYDTVALEAICIGYLGGASEVQAQAPSIKTLMEGMSAEDVLMVVEQVFPDLNITVMVDS